MHPDLSPIRDNQVPVYFRRRIPRIVRICDERPAEDCDCRPLHLLSCPFQPVNGKVEHVGRHEIVNRPGREKQRLLTRWPVERPSQHLHTPFEVVGILGEAVTTNASTRPEDRPGHTFFLQRCNPFPDIVEVYSHCLAIEGELVCRCDLEIPEGVLGSLLHLGSGRGHRDDLTLREKRGIQLDCSLRTCVIDSSDDPVMFLEVSDQPSHHHPFWSMGDAEVLPCGEPRFLFEDIFCDPCRGTRGDRGLEHHKASRSKIFPHVPDTSKEGCQIRFEVFRIPEGCLDGNGNCITVLDPRKIRGA